MWTTLVNKSSKKELQSYFQTSSKVQQKIIPEVNKAWIKKYEDSHENMRRSFKVLYDDGLLSKRKYKSVSKNISCTGESVHSPKLVYYDKLIAFIKSVEIANVHDFPTDFCKDLESLDEPVNGSYRDLRGIVRNCQTSLANLQISISLIFSVLIEYYVLRIAV